MAQLYIDFDWRDEGFFWYCVQRTLSGHVPLRDFQAYDPGRYLWTAGLSFLFGDGIVAVRAAAVAFQFIGLTAGLFSLVKTVKSSWALLVAGLFLLVWMYPRHKLFEPSIAMGAVFFGTIILRSPSGFNYFLGGTFIGLAAFFGRNHGLYGFVGLVGAALFVHWKCHVQHFGRKLVSMGVGMALGLSPFVVMAFIFPGFGVALGESLLYHLTSGNLNLSLPVPWPWKAELASLVSGSGIPLFFHGILLIIVPLFYSLVVAACMTARRISFQESAPLISGALIGIPYLHHAFARADLSHLAQAIHPFLIGVLALPALARGVFRRAASLSLLGLAAVLTVMTVVKEHPAYKKWKADPQPYVQIEMQGDCLWVTETTAKLVKGLYAMEREHFSKGGEVLAVPHLPSVYAVLGRKSPLWQTYFFFPEEEEKQIGMIRQIEEVGVKWVIMGEGTLDGREDLRFRNTHRLVWRHVKDNFMPVAGETLPGGYQLYRRR